MSVFRRLRGTLGENYSGTDSLKLFLYLLAKTADDSEGRITRNKTLFTNGASLVSSLRQADWQALQDDLLHGRESSDGLVPDITLVLRHAAGQLFQEAHYEAIFGPPQESFPGFLPNSVRLSKEHEGTGVHFTPSALARTLVETALYEYKPLPRNLLVFDPACGSGEFLREVLRQLELQGFQGKLRLIGWDVSAAASEMARFALAWETQNTPIEVDYEITCRDSLQYDWPKDVDIILMNPPFTS